MPVRPRDAGTFGCDDIGGNRCILLAHRKLLLTVRRLASAHVLGAVPRPINTSYGTVTYGAVSRLAGPECVTNSLRAVRAGTAAPGWRTRPDHGPGRRRQSAQHPHRP